MELVKYMNPHELEYWVYTLSSPNQTYFMPGIRFTSLAFLQAIYGRQIITGRMMGGLHNNGMTWVR